MMLMPKISQCDVSECAYNHNKMCHALAITVGGGADHMCDTFIESEMQGGDPQTVGSVGACRCMDCGHNDSLECQANEIQIGHMKNEVDCMTYRSKKM